jgi:hypothetical protein
MTHEELEIRVKSLEELVRSQAAEITRLNDLEKIKNLQRYYGYFLEHWMAQDIIDLFADGEDVSLTLAAGTFLGKAGVRRYFERNKPDNEFFHQVMQLSGIVNIEPDGLNASGRWYGYGGISVKIGQRRGQGFISGIYLSEYVKVAGIWKFKKLQFEQFYSAKPLDGWVKPEKVDNSHFFPDLAAFKADIPRTYNPAYPSGYIVPFQEKHPVTGKPTGEGPRNELIKDLKEFRDLKIAIL